MRSIKSIKNAASKILLLLFTFSLVAGCSAQISDKSLKTEPYNVTKNKVLKKMEVLDSDLTGVYNGIEDMLEDSDYVVAGEVKDIGYFEDQHVLLRKLDILVSNCYKGGIRKNTLVSILENDGYLRLKPFYEELKKYYEENNGVKEKEADWLYDATYMTALKDIENDMLIQYYYIDKVDSKIGDKLLLFLTDSSDDTYRDKKVTLAGGSKLSYPEGAYAPLGLGMGKFTLTGDTYHRYNYYYTPEGTIDGIQIIRKSYTAKEVEEELARSAGD